MRVTEKSLKLNVLYPFNICQVGLILLFILISCNDKKLK